MKINLVKRLNKMGEPTYYADYRVGRKRMRKALGANKALAKQQIEAIQKELYLGTYCDSKKKNITVLELADDFLRIVGPKRRESTNIADRERLNYSILPFFRNMKIGSITRIHVEEWLAHRLQKNVLPVSLNRELGQLKAMFNRAIEWQYIAKSSVVAVKPLKVAEKPFVVLSDKEIDALLEACQKGPTYLYGMVLISINVGLRWSELRHLRWCDVNLKHQFIDVVNMDDHITKSGKSRRISMTESVIAYFQSIPRGIGENYVFGNPNGDPIKQLRRSFPTAVRRAGVPNLPWKDLRHQFGSHLAMKGIPLMTIQKLMGHASIQTTMIYLHLTPEHMTNSLKEIHFGHKLDTMQSATVIR